MKAKEIPIVLEILNFIKQEHSLSSLRAYRNKQESSNSFWEILVGDYNLYQSEDFKTSKEAIRTAYPALRLLFVYTKTDIRHKKHLRLG